MKKKIIIVSTAILALAGLVFLGRVASATQQNINVGTTNNDGTGDTLRTAFQKTQSNFDDIYGGTATPQFTKTNDSRALSLTNSSNIFGGTFTGTVTNLATNAVITNDTRALTLTNTNNVFAGTFLGITNTNTIPTNQFVNTIDTRGLSNSGVVHVTGGLSDATGTYPVASNTATVTQIYAVSNSVPIPDNVTITNTGGVLTVIGSGLSNIAVPQGFSLIGSATGMSTNVNGIPNTSQSFWYQMGNSNLAVPSYSNTDAQFIIADLNPWTPGSSLGVAPISTNTNGATGFTPLLTNVNGTIIGISLAQIAQLQLCGPQGPVGDLPNIADLIVSYPGQFACACSMNWNGGSNTTGNYPFWLTDPVNARLRFPNWNFTNNTFNVAYFTNADTLDINQGSNTVTVGGGFTVSGGSWQVNSAGAITALLPQAEVNMPSGQGILTNLTLNQASSSGGDTTVINMPKNGSSGASAYQIGFGSGYWRSFFIGDAQGHIATFDETGTQSRYGFASAATGSAVVNATGITNNNSLFGGTLTVNAKEFLTGAGITFTNYNNAGTAYLTNTITGTNVLVDILQAGGYTRGAGLAGMLVPE